MKFTFTVTKSAVKETYEKVVDKAVKDTALKGFRKGQAPRDMVIKAVGENKLQQQAIEMALPEAYTKEVKKKKLKPVSYPKIDLKSGTPGSDFVFEAEVAEAPEVKLGDYEKKLKGEVSKSKIWTPEKGDKDAVPNPQESEQQKNEVILKCLLDTVKVEVPELLVEREVNRMLSRLLDQVDKLGLKIDDYLASSNQTQESLKKEYEKSAKQNLALEFILMEVAKDKKVEATAEQVDSFIASVGDEKLRKQLQSPEERGNIYVMLTKQNVIQKLQEIAS